MLNYMVHSVLFHEFSECIKNSLSELSKTFSCERYADFWKFKEFILFENKSINQISQLLYTELQIM